MANDLDRLLGVYSQPVRSWPGEEALDEEALANYAAMNPAAPAKLRPDETFRGTFLPFRETGAGNHEWAVPGFLQDVWDAAKTVRDTSGTGLGGMIRPSQYPQDQFDQIIGHGMAGAMTGITGGLARTAIRSPAGTMDLGMFGGRRGAEALAAKGETRPLQALDMLEHMEKAGKSRDEIWAATNEILKDSPYAGAFRPATDNLPRFEIDDSQAPNLTKPKGRMGSVFPHEDLFDAYPALARTYVAPGPKFESQYLPGLTGAVGSRLMPSRVEIGKGTRNVRSTILHENQHGIQREEGFAPGSSARRVGLNDYWDTAGEVEARTVQKRQDLSPEERRSRPPWEDYDIPESQQIVRFGDKGPQMAASEPFKLERRPMNPVKLHEIGDATYSTPYVVERKVSSVPISDLVGSAHTPEKVAPLAEAIRNNRWIEPLVIDREGNVIEGQHRLRALQQLGFSKVPVHRIRELIPHDAATRIEKAAQGAGIHSQQARQIAKQVAEIIDAEGAGELRYYEPPRGFENAWRAAVKEATSAEVDKMLSAYSPRKARDDVQMSASDPTIPLPMDEASRLARAREMGVDMDTTYYRGQQTPVDEMRKSERGLLGPGVYVNKPEMRSVAGEYALDAANRIGGDPMVYPLWGRGKVATLADVEAAEEAVIKKMGRGAGMRTYKEINDELKARGFSGRESPQHGEVMFFEPSDMRSPRAVFDPAKKDSANLLASHRVPLPVSREDERPVSVEDILNLYNRE